MLRLLFPYVPYLPHPKQAAFLSDALSGVSELLYGGAAGGGKSDALLMGALQYIDVPGYAALIVRKTYGELSMEGGIMDRAHLWLRRLLYVEDPDGVLRLVPGQLPPNVVGNESKHAAPDEPTAKPLCGPGPSWGLGTWVAGEYKYQFASGATLRFGHLQTKEARLRYAGSEFQYIGVDELTTLGEQEYVFLNSRLRQPEGPDDDAERERQLTEARTTGKLQTWMLPLRMRAGTNPGGPGHAWVKRRFIGDPKKDIPRAEASARFLPATLIDNPTLGKSYRAQLEKLDAVTRRQLLLGSWDDIIVGELFQRGWFELIPEWKTRGTQWALGPIRYWDLAATEEKKNKNGTAKNNPDFAVGVLMAHDGTYWYILDIVRLRNEPAGVDAAIDATAKLDGPGVQIYVEQEPGASGKMVVNNIARRLHNRSVEGHRPTGSKETRAKVWSSKAEQHLVRVVEARWNDDFFEEAEFFPEGEHDDQVDGVSGAFDRLGFAGEAEQADSTEDDADDERSELQKLLGYN